MYRDKTNVQDHPHHSQTLDQKLVAIIGDAIISRVREFVPNKDYAKDDIVYWTVSVNDPVKKEVYRTVKIGLVLLNGRLISADLENTSKIKPLNFLGDILEKGAGPTRAELTNLINERIRASNIIHVSESKPSSSSMTQLWIKPLSRKVLYVQKGLL